VLFSGQASHRFEVPCNGAGEEGVFMIGAKLLPAYFLNSPVWLNQLKCFSQIHYW
jgi:hypothetical protein